MKKRKCSCRNNKKYSKGFFEEGMKYIEKDMNLTTVVKIEIDHISGKASRL